MYEMRLAKEEGSFLFEGYTEIAQLGRYYSLTLNDQTTRLYSGVNFLMEDNLAFMERYLEENYGVRKYVEFKVIV